MDVTTLIAELGRTPSATARATGLSRMTVQRVRDGISSPTLATLRELALAAGYDVDVRIVPAGDPMAAIAARVLLDPAIGSPHTLEEAGAIDHDELASWLARLERRGESDPRRLLAIAGQLAAPQHRKGARFFRPRSGFSPDQLIDIAGSALAGHRGALSGSAAVRTYLEREPASGPVIVWTDDPGSVADRVAASLREADEYQAAGVLVAPAPPAYLIDMLAPPSVPQPVVSPIQAAIDLHGLGYSGLADAITEGW